MEEDFKNVLYKKTHSSGSLTSNRKPTTAGSQTFYTKGGPSYSSRVSTFSSSLSKEAQSSGTKGKQSMSDHELAQLMQAEFDNEDRQPGHKLDMYLLPLDMAANVAVIKYRMEGFEMEEHRKHIRQIAKERD